MKIAILVQPRASKTEVVGWIGAALKVRLVAPPVDGEANSALVQFLAKEFGLKKRHVTLCSGLASRKKVVDILVADEAALMEKLNSYGIEAANR